MLSWIVKGAIQNWMLGLMKEKIVPKLQRSLSERFRLWFEKSSLAKKDWVHRLWITRGKLTLPVLIVLFTSLAVLSACSTPPAKTSILIPPQSSMKKAEKLPTLRSKN